MNSFCIGVSKPVTASRRKAALSPADVIEVRIQPGTKNCRVVVPDDQLSLAIGREGQNARLAARLTGYKIDIKPRSYDDSAETKAAEASDADAEAVETAEASEDTETLETPDAETSATPDVSESAEAAEEKPGDGM